jgi:hypothetical protein
VNLTQQEWDGEGYKDVEPLAVVPESTYPTNPVLAAYRWNSNADLIADVARLGYLREDWVTLDPTYGRGMWWKKWRPRILRMADIMPGEWLDEGWRSQDDFTEMMWQSELFDAVAFDPPYVSVGGRSTTGMVDFAARYGMHTTPKSPLALQLELVDPGIRECVRVLKPRGILLVKNQDYISSGRYWPGTHHTLTYALSLGLELVDRFEMMQPRPRPQPSSNRRQVHARRNLSTLFVFRKAS